MSVGEAGGGPRVALLLRQVHSRVALAYRRSIEVSENESSDQLSESPDSELVSSGPLPAALHSSQ